MKEIRTNNLKVYRILNRLKAENSMILDRHKLSKNDKKILNKAGAKVENNKIFLSNRDFKVYLRKV